MKLKFDRILIATTNEGKVREIKQILSQVFSETKFISLSELTKVKEPEENGKTFLENALKKARYYYSIFGIPLIAEDSGLEVEALNGEPGIHSSNYAGPNSTQKQLIEKLLSKMKGKENRNARFVSVVVFMYEKDKYIFAEGRVKGRIAEEPRGKGGFGYDPIFIPEGYDKTFAELGDEIKNKISHRRNALVEIAIRIKETLL